MGNPYISLLRTAWSYTGREKSRFIKIYVMFVFANLVVAIVPLLYGWFIDSLQKDGIKALRIAWIYAAVFVGLKLLEWVFHGPARVMEHKLAFHISRNFMVEHYHKVVHMSMNWHQEHHTGSTISKVRKGYESLKDFFQNGFVYTYALGRFLLSFAAMIYFSPLFGSVAVVLGIVTIFMIILLDKPFIRSLKEVNERQHAVMASLFDSLSNIITVITLRLERRMEINMLDKINEVYPPFRLNVITNELKWFVAQVMVAVIYAVVVLGYVYQHMEPGTPFFIGGLVTLIGYVNQFTGVFGDIAAQYTRLLQYNSEVEAAKSLVGTYKVEVLPPSAGIPKNWKNIHIANLNFSHATSRKVAALTAINMRFARGRKVALIGESGSGKSTVLALLRGLYQVENDANSNLYVDDQEVSFRQLASMVSLFPQEPEIFENTIRYNITLGLEVSEEEIDEACRLAGFYEVLEKLPNGLDSFIQEKGVNLSGGQKQRLALARGILAARTSPVVLLDEPTSSVDPRNELQIYQGLFERYTDKVVVSSLHRLHLLTNFDYIYVLDQGKVVDEGTFARLKAESPLFQSMWKHQKDAREGDCE